MRIDFRMDGGIAAFPGLAKPVSIDCEALPPAETARLRTLVQRAGFLPHRTGKNARRPRPTRARTRSPSTTAANAGPSTVTEPIADDALRDLVAELRAQADALRGRR